MSNELRRWIGVVETAFATGSTHLISTPAFKSWFRNSKVVDKQGDPLVVYHGTDQDFDIFDRTKSWEGFFFTTDPDRASRFSYSEKGGRVIPVYLSIQNPAWSFREYYAATEMQRRGYDGVIYDENQNFLVFSPNQIKSAIGNTGSFDPSKPAIHD